MTRKLIKCGTLLAAGAAAVFITGHVIGADTDKTAVPAAAPDSVVQSEPAKYILRSHGGKIALYSDGFSTHPAVETDIDISGLREYDRKLLENGIEAETYEDVLRLIEDFSS